MDELMRQLFEDYQHSSVTISRIGTSEYETTIEPSNVMACAENPEASLRAALAALAEEDAEQPEILRYRRKEG